MRSDPTYEEIVENILTQWDNQIEQLKGHARNADPEESRKYLEAIGFLVANREAARRGLLRVSESEIEAAASRLNDKASDESDKDSVGSLKEALFGDLDVTMSPKQTYGRE